MNATQLLSTLALSAALCAQTPPCASLNDTNTTVSNAITASAFAGPGTWGWQYTPSTSILVSGLQLFTTNNFVVQSMGLEIWDHDPATSLPKTKLAGGYWKITKSNVPAWQGTNLSKPVVLAQGTPYWIVWVEPGFSTVPIEPGGTLMPAARINGGVWTVIASQQALKFRLFCSLLDRQGVALKGAACVNSAGLGTTFCNQAPTVGNADFKIEGTGFPSAASGLLLLGVVPTWPSLPIPGADPLCLVHTDIVLTVSGTAGAGNVRDPLGAVGQFNFAIAIPADPALAGGVLTSQIAAVDPGSTFPLQFVTTNGLVITIQ